jgi:DNA-binding CsgD family transcriptional regulator/tetratricopeptide (TPR) repeat protein
MTGMPATMDGARFVGRDAAFIRLAPALELAAGGEATAVLIDGPGGVGVSRFVTEVTRRATSLSEPFRVIRGRSYRPGSDDPYGAIVRALRPVFRDLDGPELVRLVGPAVEDLVRLFPEIQARLASAGALPTRPTITAPERRQGRVLEAILGVVGRLSEGGPVLVVLEDLHDADAGTRALLTFLSRVRRHHRVCFIGTWASDELVRDHPFSASLAEATGGEVSRPLRLRIDPFERAELATLVQAIEGERPLGSALVLVAERSRGLPLIAEELLAARREVSDASLTDSFNDLVIARLARRGPECRRVLRLVALSGRPLDRDELADTAATFELTADRLPPRSTSRPRRGDGTLDPDLNAGLDEAIEQGILVEEPDGIAFRHEHIRRAAAADLLPRLRRRHHLALASGMIAHPGEAAGHWVEANVSDRAFAAAVDAAGHAEAAHSPDDALAALELALALYEPAAAAARPSPARASATSASPASRASKTKVDGSLDDVATPLNLRAAEAAFAAGRHARAVAYIEALIYRFDERRDRLALAMVLERLGRYRRVAGDRVGALTALERALELASTDPSLERATILAALGQARMIEGSFDRSEQLAREAIRMAEQLGSDGDAVRLHATTTLGVTLGWGDQPEAAVDLLREALVMAEARGDLDQLFRVYANLTTVLDLLGRRGEAVDVATEGIDASRRAGLEAVFGNFLRANASDSLYLLGRWPESRVMSETALEWSPGSALARPPGNLAIVEIETNAGETAARLLGQLLVGLDTISDAQHTVPIYRAAASLALWQGDHTDAARAAARGWEVVRDTGDWSLIAKMAATVAEVDSIAAADAGTRRDLAALAGIRARSKGVVGAARKAVERSGVRATIGSRQEADAWLAQAAAHRDRLEGRDDPATWDRLAGSWVALANPYERAKARWHQAEAILGSGEGRSARAKARPVLEEAAAIAVGLEARPLLREVAELAGRAMIRLPAAETVLASAGSEAVAAGVTVGAAAAGAIAGTSTAAAAIAGPAVAASYGHDGNGAGLVAVGPGHDDDRARAGGPAGGPPDARDGPSPLVRGIVGDDPSPRRDTFGLSRREREVLALIAEGRTNREIGERLFISQKTVGVHVGNILAKLGVSGRVEAAAVSIRLGLTDPATTGTTSGR